MDFAETRKALGLSQSALGELLGVDQGTVSRFETGALELSVRTKLALEALLARKERGDLAA